MSYPAVSVRAPFLRSMACLALGLALVLLSSSAAFAKKNRGAAGTYDEGRLINAYFGDQDFEWRETDEVDYVWVREGFELGGKSYRFDDWPEVEFQGPKAGARDAKDRALARELNASTLW